MKRNPSLLEQIGKKSEKTSLYMCPPKPNAAFHLTTHALFF